MIEIRYTKPRLRDLTRWDGEGFVHYLFGDIVQVSPTQALVFINIHQYGLPVDDLEAGVDAIVFDSLDAIDPARAIPLVRNDFAIHPRNGRKLLMVRACVFGGFVPLGARLPDGRPHPHAGTGFGRNTVVGYPADHSIGWPAGEPDLHQTVELQQYRFDGTRLHIESTRVLGVGELLPGWELPDGPINNATPDGEDLLLGATGGRPGKVGGAGVTRWRRVDGAWRVVDFTLVTGDDTSCEPTLVRAADGSLVMAVRGARSTAVHRGLIRPDQVKEGAFQLWRSTDGKNWTQVLDVDGPGNPCPISINRTVGGQLFLASNPTTPEGKRRNGTPVSRGGMRCSIHLWPIDEKNWTVGKAFPALDCESRFGPSPGGSPWLADHPNSAIVRLADGKLHALLCTRVAELDETCSGQATTPHSGCWIDEVRDVPPRDALPLWKFA